MSSVYNIGPRRRVSIRGHPPDLEIKCGNRTFKTHEEQLDGCALVEIYDIEPSVLSCILDYFYTGDFDESGSSPYIPSTLDPNAATETPFRSPSGSPSAERNKRLAAVYTMAQKYKISELKELVKGKFASNGKLSDYLSAIVKDANLKTNDMGRTLHVKLQKVALASIDSPDASSPGQTEEDSDGNDGVNTPRSNNITTKSLEDEKVNNPTNTPVVDDASGSSALLTLQALNENLQTELATVRASFENQTKESSEHKSQLLVLKHEKLQAELSRDSALERLDGLMKVLNETKRCKNTGCLASLNVLVQDSEVRMGGNVTIRCGNCNARQR
ncbi:hypothetical protein TWF481_009896 [Arthrobotrys musiformis]|uniref:BTB domain-containing protein n=1 Tax=Arthrobotrys musiformis TaxID=47236 RepID=A0AAV9W562_9PEZI